MTRLTLTVRDLRRLFLMRKILQEAKWIALTNSQIDALVYQVPSRAA